MFLESYCNVSDDKISFTRQQASDFAKKIADDMLAQPIGVMDNDAITLDLKKVNQ